MVLPLILPDHLGSGLYELADPSQSSPCLVCGSRHLPAKFFHRELEVGPIHAEVVASCSDSPMPRCFLAFQLLGIIDADLCVTSGSLQRSSFRFEELLNYELGVPGVGFHFVPSFVLRNTLLSILASTSGSPSGFVLCVLISLASPSSRSSQSRTSESAGET